MMPQLLNLGCGNRFHTAWTNIDFYSSNNCVIAHNLLKGIPYKNNYFDAVYHSHLLEHFSKSDAMDFLNECFRVLKPGGTIRVAVPDLERIAKEYLLNLETALQGNETAVKNYEWILLELYDQTVRNETGGAMAKYLLQKELPNEDYVFKRIGEEGRNIRKSYFANLQQTNLFNGSFGITPLKKRKIRFFDNAKQLLKRILFSEETLEFENLKKEADIGRFRLGGEIHQWMYDRFSLRKLLLEAGFNSPQVVDAFTSKINEWNSFELESKNGVVYKPDSLFMEGIK